MKLEDIGFYTLHDKRARQASHLSPLWRCELLLTKRCNFQCPYCRSVGPDKDITLDDAKRVVGLWSDEGLKNVRFSGGEPTIWKGLVELVEFTKARSVERIALSTNGSADMEVYQELIDAGVDDFSISLDACCAEDGDEMSGRIGQWGNVINNIRAISEQVYVSVGVVLTPETAETLPEIIDLAHRLGVEDIRIITSAQWNGKLDVGAASTSGHQILEYRLKNLRDGLNIRGLLETDSHKCPLALDDMAVMDGFHYPCVIAMREGCNPIGKVGSAMREERRKWYESTDTHKETICQKNCLDVCRDYNNRYAEIRCDCQM